MKSSQHQHQQELNLKEVLETLSQEQLDSKELESIMKTCAMIEGYTENGLAELIQRTFNCSSK